MSLEGEVIDRLLTRIRRRNLRRATANQGTGVIRPRLAAKGVVRREAHFADFEAAVGLKRRLGLGPDSVANWLRLWSRSPAFALGHSRFSMGWVLEARG